MPLGIWISDTGAILSSVINLISTLGQRNPSLLQPASCDRSDGLPKPCTSTQLIGIIALTMLFLVLQGLQVVTSGKRRLVDPHWNRGMSYLKLGWNWIRFAITQQSNIQCIRFLSSAPDAQPAIASKRQLDDSFKREFIVLNRIPAS